MKRILFLMLTSAYIFCLDFQGINALSINNDSLDIKIRYNIGKTKLTLDFESIQKFLDDNYDINTNQKGAYLSVDIKRKKKIIFLRNKKKHRTLVIGVPSSLKNMQIESSSGGFEIMGIRNKIDYKFNLQSGELKLKNLKGNIDIASASGQVKIDNIKSDKLMIDIQSGDIDVSDSHFKDASLKTSSGHIDFEETYSNNTKMSSQSGDIDVSDSHFKDASLKTSSGHIDFEETYSNNTKMSSQSGDIDFEDSNGIFDIKTTSGKIDGDNISTPQMSLQTNSGSIKIEIRRGNLLRDYILDLSSDFGDIKVGKDKFEKQAKVGNGRNYIYAKSKSGDIIFKN